MKYIFFLVFLGTFVIGCNGQEQKQKVETSKTTLKTTAMPEKLDIKEFRELAEKQGTVTKPFGEDSNVSQYSVKYKDVAGAEVEIFGSEVSGYVKNIIPPDPELFYTHKEYFPNGYLKTEGLLFKKGEFMKGNWKTYDENGKLVGEVDHDKKYKYSYESMLSYTRQKGIDIFKNRYFELVRGNIDEEYWYLTWEKAVGEGIIVEKIDGQTGKRVDTWQKSYPEE